MIRHGFTWVLEIIFKIFYMENLIEEKCYDKSNLIQAINFKSI